MAENRVVRVATFPPSEEATGGVTELSVPEGQDGLRLADIITKMKFESSAGSRPAVRVDGAQVDFDPNRIIRPGQAVVIQEDIAAG